MVGSKFRLFLPLWLMTMIKSTILVISSIGIVTSIMTIGVVLTPMMVDFLIPLMNVFSPMIVAMIPMLVVLIPLLVAIVPMMVVIIMLVAIIPVLVVIIPILVGMAGYVPIELVLIVPGCSLYLCSERAKKRGVCRWQDNSESVEES